MKRIELNPTEERLSMLERLRNPVFRLCLTQSNNDATSSTDATGCFSVTLTQSFVVDGALLRLRTFAACRLAVKSHYTRFPVFNFPAFSNAFCRHRRLQTALQALSQSPSNLLAGTKICGNISKTIFLIEIVKEVFFRFWCTEKFHFDILPFF